MPRRSIFCDSYAGFQRDVAEFLAEHRQREVLIIAASRGAADDVLWTAGSDGALGVHRFTLSQTAAMLAAGTLAERRLRIADAFASEAVAARVAWELRQRKAWRYFTPVAEMPGFPRALARTLTELRMNGVSPAECRKGRSPGVDLAAALTFYSEQLSAFSLADVADLHRLALETAQGGPHRLLGLPLLILDSPVRTEFARKLMAALTEASPAALACTLSHDKESCEFYDGLMEHRSAQPPAPGEENTLARVRRWLFSTEPPERTEVDDTVDYFSAPGEAMECVEIARRIVRLAADGMGFDRIAVLLRSPDRYQPLLEEALDRTAIQAYFSRGVVRPDPGGRAFVALLTCALENCSASRFAEYLSLGQTPSAGERGPERAAVDDEIHEALLGQTDEPAMAPDAEPADEPDDTSPVIAGTLQTPAQWEHLLVDAAVVGGADRWERRLNALGNELRLKLDRSDGHQADQAYYEAELLRLENLRAFAVPLIQQLSSLPGAALWGEWLAALRELARSSLRMPGHVVAVLDELEAMSDIGPVGLEEVTLVLGDRLRFLRREPEGRRYGRVFVGGIEEARGRVFDVVFTPGLAEGIFPQKVSEDPLLLDNNRQAIADILLTSRRRGPQERLLLSIAVAAASRRFVFSWPRIDLAQSRPRVPSFYALEAIRAAHGFLPDLRGFQEEASGRAPSRLDRPAPRMFDDAIDDTEYDLVALDFALTAKGGERQGALGYLTKVSDALARSLRARYSRWEMRKWTAHDGLLNTDATLGDALAAYRLAARPYSPTALQSFAACPYRFALLGMHGLRPRDTIQPLNQMDPLTRGALFHAIQHEFFERARAAGLLPVTSANLNACRGALDGALNDVAEKYADELAPAIVRVWRAELEDIRTDLHGWLQQICGDSGWIPIHFELAFGLRDADGRDAGSLEDPVTLPNGTRLRGAIDLVERHSTRGTLRVVDHKTGKPPDRAPAVVGGGVALQPLLYALAAETGLGARVESGRLFYCTQRGNYRAIDIPATPDARLRIERVLAIIDNAIATGTLPAAPARDACKNCDCRSVCGPHEEMRWRRKIGPLEELEELRNMP